MAVPLHEVPKQRVVLPPQSPSVLQCLTQRLLEVPSPQVEPRQSAPGTQSSSFTQICPTATVPAAAQLTAAVVPVQAIEQVEPAAQLVSTAGAHAGGGSGAGGPGPQGRGAGRAGEGRPPAPLVGRGAR